MIELANLNEDITLDILLCCDVFSILRIEQTCKYLRKVSLYRHLWLTLATNLDYDHAPNLLPHESLQSLSTDRLREMVIRSTRSYLNWTRPEGPKPTRSIAFEIPVPLITLLYKLLPGAKYLVVLDMNGRFYVYDTDSQAQIGFYTVVYTRCTNIQGMDCLLVDEGNTLVLAYAFKTVEDLETCVTVVRFDIHSGTSEIAQIFTFSHADFGLVWRVLIGPEVVVVQESGRILVSNWRTGKATEIVFESGTIVHSSFMIENHLFVGRNLPGNSLDVSAIPLSAIFWDRSGCNSTQSGALTPYTSVRSQDVLRESTRAIIVYTSDLAVGPHIDSVSVCTSSWKTPSMCEHDAPATPTRLLLLVCIRYQTYMVSELLFSPASTNTFTHSMLSNAATAPRNEYLLTCRRRCLVRMSMPRLTSATRAGRLFSIYNRPLTLDTDNRTYNATAISMLDPLEETVSDGSTVTTSTPSELFMGRTALPSPIDPLLNDAFPFDLGGVEVDTYSGAICYFAGSTFFIHRTD